ncbi:hypothetical protein [Carnobacterium maltaromaticum]|uniref:hypothetical protein n=1 Tax=Carnobacterium maltaromaticum TaxID=2751 RepID=UPI00295ECFB4|nr:hypothetical protein [Carnobacterium maltaromaticum]
MTKNNRKKFKLLLVGSSILCLLSFGGFFLKTNLVQAKEETAVPKNTEALLSPLSASEAKKVSKTNDLTRATITAKIQQIAIGGKLSNTLSKLFDGTSGTTYKLKNPVTVDSSSIGFHWVEATLIDSVGSEIIVPIPVNIFNLATTYISDTENIAIDIGGSSNTTSVYLNEVVTGVNNNSINTLLLGKVKPKSWNTDNGLETEIVATFDDFAVRYGQHYVTFKAVRADNKKFVERTGKVNVTDPLEEGWESSSINGSVQKDLYKLFWSTYGVWRYTYEGSNWLYLDKAIESALIIDGSFLPETSDIIPSNDMVGKGFLGVNFSTTQSLYTIDKTNQALKRTFIYKDKYKIEILMQLNQKNMAEVTYTVTNLDTVTKKIGISQFADVFVGSDSVPVTPISYFKGINLTYGTSGLTVLPDPESMPNWAAGSFAYTPEFGQYDVKNSTGVGWETGKQYYKGTSKLEPPVQMQENVPLSLGDSGVSMKNPGVDVAPFNSYSFKQKLKYGLLSRPTVTLDQTSGSIYKDEVFEITGSIVDKDTENYRLYLQMDDVDKTLILLKNYANIPENEVQSYKVAIEGQLFNHGAHPVSIIGINEYGAKSFEQKLTLNIIEVNATPVIQKVKIGETLSNDLKVLFTNISGTDPNAVRLKEPISVDSSKVGFQWVNATIVDGAKTKETALRIPVNIYNPQSTVFNDSDQIALDADKTLFPLVDVRAAANAGTLDQLVLNWVQPKAWNMADGTNYTPALTVNGIKPVFGDYSGTFKVTRPDTLKVLQKVVVLSVGGELKFKSVPTELGFKTTNLNTTNKYVDRVKADWTIQVENTIGSNWTLLASATPLKTDTNKMIKDSLILKRQGQSDLTINSSSQPIANGNQNEINATIQWDSSEGLLLKMDSGAITGKYTSQIEWVLSDAPF